MRYLNVKNRQYEAIPEVEMDAQIQVDWSQTKQKTRNKEEIKLYFIYFVLFYRIAATNILNGWTGPLQHKIPFVRMKMRQLKEMNGQKVPIST